MLKAGRIQTLTVSRVSEYGLYLADEEQNEVLLPNRYTSLTDKVGDRKEVFLYHDSEDRLVATTETPLLREGEAGYLRVVDQDGPRGFPRLGTARQGPVPPQPQPAGRHPGRTQLHRLPLRRQHHGRWRGHDQTQEFHKQRPDHGETPRGGLAAGGLGERNRLPRDRQQPPLGHDLPQPDLPSRGRRRPAERLRPGVSPRTTAST